MHLARLGSAAITQLTKIGMLPLSASSIKSLINKWQEKVKSVGFTVRNVEPFQKPSRQAKSKTKTKPEMETAISIVMTY